MAEQLTVFIQSVPLCAFCLRFLEMSCTVIDVQMTMSTYCQSLYETCS